jgi:hypothetical protein
VAAAALEPEVLKDLLDRLAQLGLTELTERLELQERQERQEQLEQLELMERLELPERLEQRGRHCLELTLALTDLQETASTGPVTRLRLTT